MRQVRFSTLILLPLIAFLLTGSAVADSVVTMKLLGTGTNNGGGVYTYPYNFSINGGMSTPLICDTYDNEVTGGETWQATVSGLLSGNGLFGSSPTNYKAAGLIFQGILAGNINPTAGNWAIWGLFSPTAQSEAYFQSSGAAGIMGQYLTAAAYAPASAFDGLVLYTPVAGTQSCCGLPQEYIGRVSVPEPGELSLLGVTLLFGLAGFAFRKQLGLRVVIPIQR
jgi:hypothetical protein